jgi:hypothetical protein
MPKESVYVIGRDIKMIHEIRIEMRFEVFAELQYHSDE